MKLFRTLLLMLTSIATALYANPTPDTKVIIDRMIVAYGGDHNIQKLNAYEQFWNIETKTTDTNGTDTRMVMMPNSLSTELVYPNKTETRMLHNNYGTKTFDNQTIQAKGPMLDAMKLQLMRLYTPLVLQKKLSHITASEDATHYILTLPQGTITTIYFVSKENYLVEKVIGKLQMGNQAMEFVTLYKDYRPLQGVMVAYKEVKYAGSINTAIMHLKKMHFLAAPKIRH